MNELAVIIEYLLLSREELTVPTLGTFRAVHTPARWMASEDTFLPPVCTVHFDATRNEDPQDIFNNSLAELYQITKDEAKKRCSEMVDEFHKALITDGSVDFGTIGIFTIEDDAVISLAPCEYGIVTPAYYALDTLCMAQIEGMPSHPDIQAEQNVLLTPDPVDNNEQTSLSQEKEEMSIIITDNQDTSTSRQDEHVTVSVKRSYISYALTIAAAILLFLIIRPTTIHENATRGSQAALQSFLQPNMIEEEDHAETYYYEENEVEDEMNTDSPLTDFTEEMMNEGFDIASLPEEMIEPVKPAEKAESIKPEEKVETVKPAEKVAPAKVSTAVTPHSYAIVLASAISEKNANIYIEQLSKRNIKASIYSKGKMRRVIIDGFATDEAAHKQLRTLQTQNTDMSAAWVLEIK